MPWWQSKLYLDGLVEEGLMGQAEQSQIPDFASLPDGLDNLASKGFNVRKVALN